MVINFVDECSSTQEELILSLKNGLVQPPYAIVATKQTNGIGSRGNRWEEGSGNLYFSFCLSLDMLPKDLPQSSASIYFASIMSTYLQECGSKIWLKWPNDFYIGDKKVGGVITTKIINIFVCGIGINLKNSPSYSATLDIEKGANDIVGGFFRLLDLIPSWKQIFSKYLLEFEKSRIYATHIDGELVSLKSADLSDDGSIILNNKKVYSLR